jgi:hypothetical protein
MTCLDLEPFKYENVDDSRIYAPIKSGQMDYFAL